jgi:hypothetical protein
MSYESQSHRPDGAREGQNTHAGEIDEASVDAKTVRIPDYSTGRIENKWEAYHDDEDPCTLMRRASRPIQTVTPSEAERKGYDPCGLCFPETADTGRDPDELHFAVLDVVETVQEEGSDVIGSDGVNPQTVADRLDVPAKKVRDRLKTDDKIVAERAYDGNPITVYKIPEVDTS